ncbi:MAG: prepilin peptidase [Micropepsaceae bacterium]
MLLQAIVLIACPVFLVLGAMTDIVSYRIPNWIPGALIVLFAIAAPLAGMPLDLAGWHALVFVAALLFGMALFAFNVIGGGDAKFFAGAALWMGPAVIGKYLLAFAFVGGVFAVLILILRRVPLATASAARLPVLNQLLLPTAGMPYGVALGIGGLIVLPGTVLFMKALAP